ncbi:MAG: class I SAM-dependent methyltransferase [Bacteroidales bacterium]|nr:class I SAM-dependent methyltransferase [Bacteroidales bacterium]
MKHMYPRNFARFYDIIYHRVRDRADSEYFRNLARQTNGKVLEIGVGTGRLFMNAIKDGADIYGIDISQSMLDILYGKLDRKYHHRISLQSIVDFSFDFKFDLVIAPFRVIMHLMDKEEQIKALNNVYQHLNSGGSFVFDVFVPDPGILKNGICKQTDFDDEYEPGKKLRRIVTSIPDLVNQVINVLFRLEWEEDDRTKIEEWKVPLRFFFRYELEHLIERSYFDEYRIIGDYEGKPLDKDSKEFIIICKRTDIPNINP